MPGEVAAGVACLLLRRDRLLMIQRKGAHGAGKWSVPGGWLEPGEDVSAAAARELMEEVGVEGWSIGHLTYTHDHHPEGLSDVCFFVLMGTGDSLKARIKEPDKASVLAWLRCSDVQEMHDKDMLFLPLKNIIDLHATVENFWEEMR